ncbi:MAG: ATP-binding cassette domain-containing protein [Anaerolineales bacterium]|nr:ATP-binding cassette domain-containing protein [Anaerolineales bacterium]
MLNVIKVSKFYGIETLLDEVSFVINTGERVALIGVNGCGKSTLLGIIAGDERPDHGSVSLATGTRLGWLRQDLNPEPDETVGEVVRSGLGDWDALRTELELLTERMSEVQGKELEQVMNAYDESFARFQILGGYDVEYQVKSMLAHFGLDQIEPKTPVAQLSGGEQTRVGLAAVLMSQPDLLLLDEPTNHLDIEALEWLEGWLGAFNGAALLVSHDRVFLDRTVSRILELEEGKIREFKGDYGHYAGVKAAERERQRAAWKDQEDEIRRLRGDIHRTKMQAKSVELTTTSGEPTIRRYAKKVAKKAISREKKLERYLKSEDRVEKPKGSWYMKLDFQNVLRSGNQVIQIMDLGHRYGDWLYRHVNLVLMHGERVVLLGPNGSGKSTLLQTIVGKMEPSEGVVRLGANVRIGYMPQMQDTFEPVVTPLGLIRSIAPMTETETRNFLHYFLFTGDDVFLTVEKLSYGERSRLLLAKLVAEGANCLILDEPINHLDIPSRERFEQALEAFPGAILTAIHDRAFIDRFATAVWMLEDGTIRRYLDRKQ